MELDYEQFLKMISLRKSQIEEASLSDDELNNEFIRLGEMETSVRCILRSELPGKVRAKLTFNENRDKRPVPSEVQPPMDTV